MKRSFIKRISALSVVLCMIFASLPLSAAAVTDVSYPKRFATSGAMTHTLSDYVDTEELREYLIPELMQFKKTVDISKFNIPAALIEDLKDFIWQEIPECFNVYSLGRYDGEPIPALSVGYKYEDTFADMLKECEEAAETLLDGIKGNDALSDVQKALLIHDRLAMHNEYDFTFSDESYLLYGALAKGSSVCNGYSKAYTYLLRRVGIKCISCTSVDMQHAWNLVMIDGEYYHVDVTWDDRTWKYGERGVTGAVGHENFLRSNSGIYETGHDADDYYAPATSTKYDSYFWQNSESAFRLVDGDIYYIDNTNQKFMKLNPDGVTGTEICSVSDTWTANNGYIWQFNYSRLDSDGACLFFTTANTVYMYDPSSGKITEVFKPLLGKYESVFGFEYDNGYLVCDINNTMYDTVDLRQIREPLILSDITAELSSTLTLAPSQTVTAEITSSHGISGYYFGDKAAYTSADITESTEKEIEFTVTDPGTYYFVAFDGVGKSSDPVSLTFCLVVLHTDGGTVECDSILTVKNNVFVLPAPEKENCNFIGWSPVENSELGIPDLEIEDPPERSDFYAVWEEIPAEVKKVFGKVTVKEGVSVTVACADADGLVLSHTVTDNGEFSLDLAEGTKYIVIFADGYLLNVYVPAKDGDTEINTELTLKGDVNEDNAINNKDVVFLFRHVSGISGDEYDALYDFNEDGAVNNKDVVALFRYVSTLA